MLKERVNDGAYGEAGMLPTLKARTSEMIEGCL